MNEISGNHRRASESDVPDRSRSLKRRMVCLACMLALAALVLVGGLSGAFAPARSGRYAAMLTSSGGTVSDIDTDPDGEPAKKQALAATEKIAAALGVPFGEGATAKLETVLRGRPEWHVEFSDVSHVSVGLDGVVTGVIDYSAIDASYQHEGLPAIPEAEAVRIATQKLALVGMTPDLVLKGATLHTSGDNIQDWVVDWQRMWQGIPFERTARAWVRLDATNGRLIQLRRSPSPPRPASTAIKLSEAEATTVALRHLSSRGVSIPEPRCTATLEIAQPELSRSGHTGPRYDDPTRVVWRVEVGRDTRPSLVARGMPPVTAVGYVQVDAATGKVVGDAFASAGPVDPP